MIDRIDIINLSHCDFGFTDHPEVCRRLQVKYIDRALELCLDNKKKTEAERFFWTIESNAVLADWWREAGRKAKQRFIEAVEAGWIEVCAMPFNNIPLMNKRQWSHVARWLPDDLWKMVKPRVIMQNDVNGVPRAGVTALMDKGCEFLWMSINNDTGGSPVPQPSAFWWSMPDGRRIFVWNSIGYPNGYYLFQASEWRKGPVPKAADTRYREPVKGDFFEVSEKSLQEAGSLCLKKLSDWLGPDCVRKRVAVPMTNMWRIDNDPPCALLPDFVTAWNATGLRPQVAVTTPAPALTALRDEWGPNAPVFEGEWTDWWVNGAASMPREMSAARKAKRLVEALESPLLGSKDSRKTADECLHDLCLFDEHTFGSWDSVSSSWSSDARGQSAAKAALAYRPLALAEWIAGKEARKRARKAARGTVQVINPYNKPFTGWVTLPNNCLRGDYNGVTEARTGRRLPLVRNAGWAPFVQPADMSEIGMDNLTRVFSDRKRDEYVEFWVDGLEAESKRTYKLEAGAGESRDNLPEPAIGKDGYGWPIEIKWKETEELRGGWGDFYSLEFGGDFPRWTYKKILGSRLEKERRQARDTMAKCVSSEPVGKTECRDKGPTVVFSQESSHPRLCFFRRELEVFKGIPRARLKATLYRRSLPESCEIFYLRVPLGLEGVMPLVTNGGLPFVPEKDQMPNTCRDYYGIDGEVTYRTGDRQIVLSCRDNALVSFGGMHDGLGINKLAGDLSDIFIILFNNIWYTNFVGDESGLMTFEFDIYQSPAGFPGYASEVFAVVNS